MSRPSTVDRPTDPTDRPPPYYQYRVTLPHAQHDEILTLVKMYSKDYAYCMHFPDTQEIGCQKEHFHLVFRDFTDDLVDSCKKRFAKHFKLAGNSFHSGKWRTNHISNAIGYFKHDEHAEIFHSGQAYWDEYVKTQPAFVKSLVPKVLKETMSYPQLTYANVLKQAHKYRAEYCPSSRTLSDVVEKMVTDHRWQPSRELLANGIPRGLHELFESQVSNKRPRLEFWLPHDLSDKKLEWTDKVSPGFYPGGVSSSGPAGTDMTGSVGVPSRRLWKDKDFSDPSRI
jgi:hypothetical protein